MTYTVTLSYSYRTLRETLIEVEAGSEEQAREQAILRLINAEGHRNDFDISDVSVREAVQ